MIEVHYQTYTTIPEQDIYSDRDKCVIPFNCIKDAIAWANYYHRRLISFTDPADCVIELEYCVRSIWSNDTRVDFNLSGTSSLTEEQADALPSGGSDCVG